MTRDELLALGVPVWTCNAREWRPSHIKLLTKVAIYRLEPGDWLLRLEDGQWQVRANAAFEEAHEPATD